MDYDEDQLDEFEGREELVEQIISGMGTKWVAPNML